MPQSQEWDWPPPRQTWSPTVDGRIERGTIVLPRAVPVRSRRLGWLGNRLASGFASVVFGLFRVLLAVVLTGVALASVALIAILLKL